MAFGDKKEHNAKLDLANGNSVDAVCSYYKLPKEVVLALANGETPKTDTKEKSVVKKAAPRRKSSGSVKKAVKSVKTSEE